VGTVDAGDARVQEGLVLKEIEVAPGLLHRVVHRAVGLAAIGAEAAAYLEVDLDIEPLLLGVEVCCRHHPRRHQAEWPCIAGFGAGCARGEPCARRDLDAERAALDRHWQQRLERARYEVERARRQYCAVEPENRLVARTLERAWEEALSERVRLEAEYERVRRERAHVGPTLYTWVQQGRLRSRMAQAGSGHVKLVHADAATIDGLKTIRTTPAPWHRRPPLHQTENQTNTPNSPTTDS
jgi:hypothetical protein